MEASEQAPAQAPEPEAPEQAVVEPQAPEPEEPPNRNPAEEQAPIATAAQNAIIGDPGFRDEQNPIPAGAGVDTPLRTSAPPAELQSGMPLPEERAAGAAPAEPAPAAEPAAEAPAEAAPSA